MSLGALHSPASQQVADAPTKSRSSMCVRVFMCPSNVVWAQGYPPDTSTHSLSLSTRRTRRSISAWSRAATWPSPTPSASTWRRFDRRHSKGFTLGQRQLAVAGDNDLQLQHAMLGIQPCSRAVASADPRSGTAERLAIDAPGCSTAFPSVLEIGRPRDGPGNTPQVRWSAPHRFGTSHASPKLRPIKTQCAGVANA